MSNLIDELRKVISSDRDISRALTDEFLSRGYKETYYAASHFQTALDREFPGINKWVWIINKREREIQDVVADELRIPGN